MLLYDQLMETGRRFVRQRRNSDDPAVQRSRKLLAVLHQCTVYDLTSVVPLFPDWRTERDKTIPRKPPVQFPWCEWTVREDSEKNPGHFVERTVGAFIRPLFAEEAPQFDALKKSHEDFARETEGASEVAVIHTFRRVNRCNPRVPEHGLQPGALSIDAFHHIVPMWNDATKVRLHRLRDIITEDDLRCRSVFGLNVEMFFYKDMYDSIQTPWPPFMAFALLHCKNVVTEDVVPEERIQRECQKHDRPPRVTYKVLKIEVPAACHRRESLEPAEGDDSSKMRFHLCSGHFKNLQHERYKNKGWHWWPAHWRGSRALGRVEKTYELQPRE